MTATELHKKYGKDKCGHIRRDISKEKIRTQEYTFCGRKCLKYNEEDVVKILEQRQKKKAIHDERYKNRPVLPGTKSKLKKVLPHKMFRKLSNAWFGMMRRCYTNERPDWRHYREFGITVCDEWLHDFDSFALWALNNGVEHGLSLDRINNDAGYCPENCRWVKKSVQGNNTSTNCHISYDGETKTISEWAIQMGINYHTLYARLKKGWAAEKALTTPSRKHTPVYPPITIEKDGVVKTLDEWSKETNIPYHVLKDRRAGGWSPEKILSTPY